MLVDQDQPIHGLSGIASRPLRMDMLAPPAQALLRAEKTIYAFSDDVQASPEEIAGALEKWHAAEQQFTSWHMRRQDAVAAELSARQKAQLMLLGLLD